MKPHVLVVDDSLIVRMDLRGSLSAAGFDVTVCETVRAAEESLEKNSFSVIVLDVNLPDGDGVELLRRIRANPNHANTPVIMLSADADVRDRVRGLSMGADEYVGKPYHIAYFIARIRELTRTRRNEESVQNSNTAGGRILVADDSPTFLRYLSLMFRDEGYDIVLAHSGSEALEMLAAQAFDCVVLDMVMPDIDGLETIRRIRQIPGRSTTPIVVLSESQSPLMERDALALGAEAFLHKSLAMGAIQARIRNVLRSRRASAGPLDSTFAPGKTQTRKAATHESQRLGGAKDQPPSSHGSSTIPNANRRTPKEGNALFAEIVTNMGLNPQLAHDTLARILARQDIDPQELDYANLSQIIPAIRDALRMYFSPDELTPKINALTSIANRPRGRTS